jgi:hypothetical protein
VVDTPRRDRNDHGLAFNGTRVLLATQEARFVRDTGTSPWKRYPFASKSNGFSAIFLSPDSERIGLVSFLSALVMDFRSEDLVGIGVRHLH